MKKAIILTAGLMMLAANVTATEVQYDLRVDGMTCPFCAATSEKALKKIKGVKAVSTDLKTAIIHVCATEEAQMSDQKLGKMLKKKGFTYVSKTQHAQCTLSEDTTDVQKTGFWKSMFHKHTS
ncbi:MAG TPA: heavy-metal-associated domain-containing protein [Hellea balneolensis]|uniref:Heavy-metal-associated domain-containing protein n=1 Tax=Hellea balneolensis TaxID=287478 RepID=A0A7C3C1C7_9PROT|nr:heavy-metal-associated domain-containing protein [Hellea balneolensis]